MGDGIPLLVMVSIDWGGNGTDSLDVLLCVCVCGWMDG